MIGKCVACGGLFVQQAGRALRDRCSFHAGLEAQRRRMEWAFWAPVAIVGLAVAIVLVVAWGVS